MVTYLSCLGDIEVMKSFQHIIEGHVKCSFAPIVRAARGTSYCYDFRGSGDQTFA